MAKFLGFRQVSLSAYTAMTEAEKYNYMWLVRDPQVNESGDTTYKSYIYFGTRLYGEVNSNMAADVNDLKLKLEHIVESLGDMIDVNGEFVGFLPSEDYALLSASTSVKDALVILQDAIIANDEKIDEKVAELEDELADAVSAITEDMKALEEKLEEATGDLDDKLSAITEQLMAKDEELDERITSSVTYLEGEIEDKVEDAIERIISGAPETFDTLKEIADWIKEHGVSAQTMFEQITENAKNIDELSAATEAEVERLDEAIASAITKAEEELAAVQAELEAENEALRARVADLEMKAEIDDRIHTIFGDDVEADGIDAGVLASAVIKDALKYGGAVELPGDVNEPIVIE